MPGPQDRPWTKGEWIYRPDVVGSGNKPISWIVGPACHIEGVGDGISVVAIAKDKEAHARLIAAAPDMAEAIALALETSGMIKGRDKLHAALSKALGGAPLMTQDTRHQLHVSDGEP
jgi:hypothetical protein